MRRAPIEAARAAGVEQLDEGAQAGAALLVAGVSPIYADAWGAPAARELVRRVWRQAWTRANKTGRAVAREALHHMAWRRYYPDEPVPRFASEQVDPTVWDVFERRHSLA